MQCLLPQITRICNVFEGEADLGDHLVFRYILPKHFCVDLVNKLLHIYNSTLYKNMKKDIFKNLEKIISFKNLYRAPDYRKSYLVNTTF